MRRGRSSSGTGTGGIARSAVIVLLIGLAVLLAAVLVAASDLSAMRRASSATGTYLDSVARVGGNHGGTFLHSRFALRPAPGQPLRTVMATSGSTEEEYRNGDTVRVCFDPADPARAWIASFWELWFGPTLLAAAGLVVALVGALMALVDRLYR